MGNIFVIGPRKSGKTTYLAGLAYWSERKMAFNQKMFTVHPLNEDARHLAEQARNIILSGDSLEGTRLPLGGVSDLPVYSFQIEVKRKLHKNETINLVVKDAAGELFDELESGFIYHKHEDLFQEFLSKDVGGCLIFLTGWQGNSDEYYAQKLRVFTQKLDFYERTKDLRVAVAITKCERGELWPGRLDPGVDLFDVHLRQTKLLLQSEIAPENLRFFALSTFGVLGRNDPRPNRINEPGWDGEMSVLRDPDKWQPYSIFSPLYWLSTGNRIGVNV
ncbi:hypothetical protein [Moorena sp. SIO3B2]|uniref:hypothetical protein n=1 Tax=Moorena sp. SIO3B2 TaxID=2607827 RepID=UPI0013CB3F60|nr:hypothetical protein [Moorena sp. SIO3B2]NEP36929.1 hypothetical protein [Moorena sp. SIO3B2]